MTNYLVLETGYEGIETVYGVFNREDALTFINEKKARALLAKKARDEYDALPNKQLDGEREKFYADHPELFECSNPDFYCVVTVSHTGTKCVCADFDVKPSTQMLR